MWEVFQAIDDALSAKPPAGRFEAQLVFYQIKSAAAWRLYSVPQILHLIFLSSITAAIRTALFSINIVIPPEWWLPERSHFSRICGKRMEKIVFRMDFNGILEGIWGGFWSQFCMYMYVCSKCCFFFNLMVESSWNFGYLCIYEMKKMLAGKNGGKRITCNDWEVGIGFHGKGRTMPLLKIAFIKIYGCSRQDDLEGIYRQLMKAFRVQKSVCYIIV